MPNVNNFFTDFWTKRHYHAQRKNSSHFKQLFAIDDMGGLLFNVYSIQQQQQKNLKNGSRTLFQDWGAAARLGNLGNLDVDTMLYGVTVVANASFFNTSNKTEISVCDAFSHGHSIVVNNAEHWWQPFAELAQSILRDVFYTCYANLYISPRNGTTFPPHADSQDLFILQLHGAKKWQLYNIQRENILVGEQYGKPGNPPLADLKSERIDVVHLNQGDTLYIPRGMPHQARASEHDTSIHLTLTLDTSAAGWGKFIGFAFDAMTRKNADFRATLPVIQRRRAPQLGKNKGDQDTVNDCPARLAGEALSPDDTFRTFRAFYESQLHLPFENVLGFIQEFIAEERGIIDSHLETIKAHRLVADDAELWDVNTRCFESVH